MLSTLTNLFVDGGGGGGEGGSQSFLHLLLTNTVACFLIGLSSMASLFAFNLLIHRRNPFSAVVRPVLNGNHHHHHQNGHHLQNGHIGNGHLGNGHAQNGYHLVSSSPPPPPPQSDPSKSELLRSVLSFAVGGLLGDVFLHLLPEASGQLMKSSTSGGGLQTVVDTQQYLGVRILAGIILFVIMESVFVQLSEADDDGEEEKKEKDEKEEFEEEEEREITLNLPAGAVVANGVLRYRGSPVKMEKMQQQLHQQQNSKGLERFFIEFALLSKNLLFFSSSEQGTVLFFSFLSFAAHRRHRVPEPAGKRAGQLYARHVGGRLLSGLLQDGRPHHAGHYHPRDSP